MLALDPELDRRRISLPPRRSARRPAGAGGGRRQAVPGGSDRRSETSERLSAADPVLLGLPHAESAPSRSRRTSPTHQRRRRPYVAAQPKINLAHAQPVALLRAPGGRVPSLLGDASSGGAPDCPGSAAAMLAALTAFANGIPITPIDPALVVSNAVTLTQGTIASGGNRFEANVIAKYMFETGQGSTAYDTSGVTPAADLTLSGNVSWVGGWGINVGQGGSAQASTGASAKLAAMIQASGEYSIEAWAAPANVAQTNAWIVSYSGSNTTRNVTLGQAATQYEGFDTLERHRHQRHAAAGRRPTANGAAQAALQHIVLTYDPVNGQKLYVNGALHRRHGSIQGRLVRQLGQHLRAGARQRDHRPASVAGRDQVRRHPQPRAYPGADPAELHRRRGPEVLPAVRRRALSGVSQSYILLRPASTTTTATCSTSRSSSASIRTPRCRRICRSAGIRIGVNGAAGAGGPVVRDPATPRSVAPTTPPTNGQLLSTLGTVIPVQLGSANDLFFLSFDQLGSHVHAFVDPPGVATPPVPNNTPQADYGIMGFERFNNTLARITGVATTDPVVQAMYKSLAAGDAGGPADRRLRVLAADGDVLARQCVLPRDDGEPGPARYVLRRRLERASARAPARLCRGPRCGRRHGRTRHQRRRQQRLARGSTAMRERGERRCSVSRATR